MIPLLLWTMGLVGGALIVAAFVGAVAYSNQRPVFGIAFSPSNPPVAAVTEVAVAKKKIPAATARVLNEAMQKITQVLDREGVNAVRAIETVGNGPVASSSKQQVYELIGRLDRLRNQAGAVENIIWNDVLPAYPSIAGELQDIVQTPETMRSLQNASKHYFDNLTTFVSLYDKVDAAGREQVLALVNPTRDAFLQAAANFQNWVQACKSRIEEKQAAL